MNESVTSASAVYDSISNSNDGTTKGTMTGGDSGYYLQINSGGQQYPRYGTAVGTVGSGGDITASNWIYTSMRFDGSNLNVYKNAAVLTTTKTGSAPSGMNDKLWIDTEYNNQSSPSTFYTIAGSAETSTDDSTPKVVSFKPPTASNNVPLRRNLQIVFNETVTADSENIVIYDAADDSSFETIACAGGLVTISSETVTINPASDFTAGKTYYVQIPDTCFKDGSSNYYSGISTTYTWRFSVQRSEGPHPLFFDNML